MRAYPESAVMVDAVVRYLRADGASAAGGDFNMRVSVNILELVARELRQQDGATAREHQRLIKLLGPGKLDALRDMLGAQIADGTLKMNDPQMLEHLRLTTLDRVSIDQPRYSAYRQAIERQNTSEIQKRS
jgi:hypothetical protein